MAVRSATGVAVPSITISVATQPQSDHAFTFTGCNAAGQCGPFVLDDDPESTLPGSVSAGDLQPGIYTVTQPGQPGWSLSAIDCDTGETADLANHRVSIDLRADEAVNCTFVEQGTSITVVENASPDAAQDFAFTGCQGSGCGQFTLDDGSDDTHENSITATGLTPATYSITQADTANWPLTDLRCTGASSVSVAGAVATVSLAEGDQVVCTFTNHTQTITITQDSIPNSPQDFAFTGCWVGGGCGPFTLDDDNDPTLDRSVTANGLGVGTYTITEAAVAGWAVTDLTCNNGESIDVVNRKGTIGLDPLEHVTCTFATGVPLEGVAQVTTGRTHSCALLHYGQARCWGRNDHGQLGDGTTVNRSTPTVVLDPEGTGPLTGIVQIGAGAAHTCARIESGQVRCWGQPASTGNGGADGHGLPVTVADPTGAGPLTGVTDIAVGDGTNCARLDDGQARCWGDNSSGELGDGTIAARNRPVVVLNPAGDGPLTNVTELSNGSDHTCARLASGEARCWGDNRLNQLGDGSNTYKKLPRVVLDPTGTHALTAVAHITAGGLHTCALLDNTQAACWGENANGRLGDGTTTDHRYPTAVSNPAGDGSLSDISHISAGGSYTCARLHVGEERCWGTGLGRLGDGTSTDRPLPVTVSLPGASGPLTGIASIDTGGFQTCASLDNGDARCWGYNTWGEVGDGTHTQRYWPTLVLTP